VTAPPFGTGHLRLTITPSPLAWGAGRQRAWARVDGEPVTVRHGDNVLPLDAGRHRVEVYQVWVAEHAAAEAEVDVPAGGEVSLQYAAPYHWRSAGRLGPPPQRPSDTWFIHLVAAVLICGLLWTVLRGFLS
jgi:hypothetical protein